MVKVIEELLGKVNGNIKTIADLLARKTMVTDIKESFRTWFLQPLYENDFCSVGIVSAKYREAGMCEPHVHPESVEYLIVTRGSIVINVDGQNVRKVRTGGVAVFQPKELHSCAPLEDNTELIYVTVPRDANIPVIKGVKLVMDIENPEGIL